VVESKVRVLFFAEKLQCMFGSALEITQALQAAGALLYGSFCVYTCCSRAGARFCCCHLLQQYGCSMMAEAAVNCCCIVARLCLTCLIVLLLLLPASWLSWRLLG
jgi:hypothetical protein